MSTSPIFANVPIAPPVLISAANTARDGTGTMPTVVTAGASGTWVKFLRFKATGATTAHMIRVYLFNGTSNFLGWEVPVAAVSAPSAVIPSWDGELHFDGEKGIFIPTTYLIKAAPHAAENFNVIAFGGNL